VACLEEIAFRQGLIDREQVLSLARSLQKSGYGEYLIGVVDSAEVERPVHSPRVRSKKVRVHGRDRANSPEFVTGRP
jgi:hypothetical protein